MADPLHQTSVTGKDVDAMVDDIRTKYRPLVAFGDRHAHGVGQALSQRSGGDLDTRGVSDLRMTRSRRTPLAKGLEIGAFQAVATQVEHRVLQDRRVTVGQNETVPICPSGVGGIMAHDPSVEDMCDRRQRHCGALMSGLRGQGRIHGETAHHSDRLALGLGIENGRRTRRTGGVGRRGRHPCDTTRVVPPTPGIRNSGSSPNIRVRVWCESFESRSADQRDAEVSKRATEAVKP